LPSGYSNIYKESSLVSVDLRGFTGVRYGFRTKVDKDSTGTALGHQDALTASGTLSAGVVMGANSPKPPRATRVTADDGYESSFFGNSVLAALKADPEWTLTPGRIRRPAATARSVPVYVEARGATSGTYKYAWMMPRAQYVILTALLTNLGISEVTDDDYDEILFGINKPKPLRAQGPAGTGNQKTSTFISAARADSLPAGWSLKGSGASSFGLD